MKNYLVSVITPFHNVDMEMFKECCQSMLQQTIGFENVQWIVVAHNCQPQYNRLLGDMLGHHDNVVLEFLDNDVHSPSSPRNHGLKMATAPYVAFLDADDRFTPHCLEEAVAGISETHSQIAWFRREFSMESNNLYPLVEIVLWNQTQRRIIVDRDHWDEEKLFTCLWGFVTSKIFDRQFLKDKDIWFDDSVSYGEDSIFVVTALAQCMRICILPQLIGYHYYINSASIIQSQEKSCDNVVNYAKGFDYALRLMDNYGIESGYSIYIYTGQVVRFMLAIPGFTLAQREAIRNYLGPYVSRMSVPSSNKVVTQDEVRSMRYLAERLIMDPQSDIMAYQNEVKNGLPQLIKILKANADTDYGQRYGFDTIRVMRDYQQRVPLTRYEDYEQLIRLQTNTGESGILTKAKTSRYIVKLSGKILPLTEDHIRPFNAALAKELKGHHSLWLASSTAISRYTNDLAFVDNLKSILVKDYICQSYYAFGRKQATFATPVSLFFSEEEEFDDYAFMCHGIADTEVDQIVALTATEVLRAFRVLEERWQEMIDEIARKNATRAEELRAVFAQGFQGIATRIWPKLQRVVAFGSGKQQEAAAQLRRYTEGVAHNHGYYITAESMIARAVGNDDDRFQLITDNDIFEFQPVDDEQQVLTLSQVQPGNTYRLIVTNQAGLYRFVTGHRVTIVSNSLQKGTIVTLAD